MSDRALSKEAMLTSLRDIRLGETAAGGWVSDVAVAIALAALLALIVAGLLRFLSVRRVPDAEADTLDLQALRALPEPARRVALLHHLRARAPERFAALREGLYRPDAALDLDALEAEVARHA